MKKLIYLFFVISIYIVCISEGLAYAAGNNKEIDVDYFHHAYFKERNINTASVHILNRTSEKKGISTYEGITITHQYGHTIIDKEKRNCSAIGIGPTYMIRIHKNISNKLESTLDMSGSLIVYNKAFPADGRAYNFMWRIGPRFIYNMGHNSSISIGYFFMHVSNGLKRHNPGYNGTGFSLGISETF